MFRGLLRPGQGFKTFKVLKETGGLTAKGRPYTKGEEPQGEIIGIISQASPKERELHKQLGHPITHTIVQYRAINRADATDVLVLTEGVGDATNTRRFLVQTVKDPGELGHFLVYQVEEREDLQ